MWQLGIQAIPVYISEGEGNSVEVVVACNMVPSPKMRRWGGPELSQTGLERILCYQYHVITTDTVLAECIYR